MKTSPAARLIGFRVTQAASGRSRGELRLSPRHVGPGGTVHGGILCDLADATMGLAFASTLRGRQAAATVELQIHFLRPVWSGRLIAVARVVHRGRRLGLVDCDLSDEAGRLIAKASSTCMVLARPLMPRLVRARATT
ncbi:MAG: PaaI family thioesterase [Candidatus Omnitrophica bacterium]|nr:PaaI family thioesterase [Candidatus Omnitrophota bacterium]